MNKITIVDVLRSIRIVSRQVFYVNWILGALCYYFPLVCYKIPNLKNSYRDVYSGGITLSTSPRIESHNRSSIFIDGAYVILIDNMGPEQIARAVATIAGKARIEASGGITPERVREIADLGVDYIAMGCLTHSAPAVDISMHVSITERGGQGAAEHPCKRGGG